jgi:glycerol-3-phosphate acyltransferase PlsY
VIDILLIVGAYLVGSISPSVLLGRTFKGIDLREHGSGNAGTTNAFRVLGYPLGAAVLVADIMKGFIPVLAARMLTSPTVTVAVALAAIAGHNWSIFMRGRGGKGVATGAGTLIAMMPLVFLFLLGVFFVVLFSTSLVSLASLSAAVFLIPAVIVTGKPSAYLVFSLLGSGFVVYAHRGNIKRLLRGEEAKSGLSWRSLGRHLRRAQGGTNHDPGDESRV